MKKSPDGFTLVEAMAVLSVIAVVMITLVYHFQLSNKKQTEVAAIRQINEVMVAVKQWRETQTDPNVIKAGTVKIVADAGFLPEDPYSLTPLEANVWGGSIVLAITTTAGAFGFGLSAPEFTITVDGIPHLESCRKLNDMYSNTYGINSSSCTSGTGGYKLAIVFN